ncbi:GGDEF domain-containing protein [Oceanicoccus sp. KOV_DT_Chl]|uniref:GGDEF domain-containing protein n=1 Tax=Oceanicoccus sp. KOV_DT_Chl TaxID=1904639 RepID=UPI000C7BCBFB|nr:GGDEF domain-containing protein [Oceanicoccus sp. KOV_DT_Chl]
MIIKNKTADDDLALTVKVNPVSQLLEWFLPEYIKQSYSHKKKDQLRSDNEYTRSILILSIYGVTGLISIIAAIYWYSIAISPSLGMMGAWIYIALMIALIMGAFIFKIFNLSTLFLGHFYTICSFLNIGVSNMLMGFNWTSPNLAAMIFIPTWTLLICGKKYGLAWSVITALYFVALYFIEPLQLNFPVLFDNQTLAQLRISGWLSAIGLLTLCLYIFQDNYSSLNIFLEQERERFKHESLHDPLTGLANRTLFHKRATIALDHALEENCKAGILYIDLDKFKPINDLHGHHIGDKLLQAVAERIRTSIRSSDTAARLGGDEFAVILFGVAEIESIDYVAEKIKHSLNEPLTIDGIDLIPSGSIGLAIAPTDGKNLDDILRSADTAMYQAKNEKR